MPQLLAVEHRQALPRVEHEGNAGRRKLLSVFEHRPATVRRNDTQPDIAISRHAVDVSVFHGTGMKRGDLVVVEIGRDISLRREGLGDLGHMAQVQALSLQPAAIGRKIPPNGRHDQRLFAQ